MAASGPATYVNDSVVLDPSLRRKAFLEVIAEARQRIVLSMFRCTDFPIMDALADALARGVRVELLLTRRVKGWEKRIRDVGQYLESMGARVHRYAATGGRYHAKYLVADGRAIVASLNLTAKCFERTADFLVVTGDPDVVWSLVTLFEHDVATPHDPVPQGLSQRLIVGPDEARERYMSLIQSALTSIQVVDHRLNDADMLALLATQEVSGRRVEVFSEGSMAPLRSHGKLMLIDGRTAALGSISLSPEYLDSGRELSIVLQDEVSCQALAHFMEKGRPSRVFGKPLGPAAGSDDDEEDGD